MGNTNSQTSGVATGSGLVTGTGSGSGSGSGSGTNIKLTCNDFNSSQNECNRQPNCFFVNGCQSLSKSNYVGINTIPKADIIAGITEVENEADKYKLFLMINNKANTSLIKSISINLETCNNMNTIYSNNYYLYPECNLFLSDIQEGEFSLKNNKIIHSFNPITSEIEPEVFINQPQLDIIKQNEYKIKLIDIYNNEVVIDITSYPTADLTQKQIFNRNILRLNTLNLVNTNNTINTIYLL